MVVGRLLNYRTRGMLHQGRIHTLLMHQPGLLLLLYLLLQGGHRGVDLVLERLARGGGAWPTRGVERSLQPCPDLVPIRPGISVDRSGPVCVVGGGTSHTVHPAEGAWAGVGRSLSVLESFDRLSDRHSSLADDLTALLNLLLSI